jgi:hypothetical protein
LGIDHTGYPYPTAGLEPFDSLDIEVQTGSVAITNGSLVHAVVGYGARNDLARQRILINFSFGHIDPKTIVHWV